MSDPARVMRAPVEFVGVEPVAHELGQIVGALLDDRTWTAPKRPAGAPAASAEAILSGLARVVREAPGGNRNNALNWAAYHAGRHVAAGTLDPEDVRAGLLDAARTAGLDEHEIPATIESGLRAGSRE